MVDYQWMALILGGWQVNYSLTRLVALYVHAWWSGEEMKWIQRYPFRGLSLRLEVLGGCRRYSQVSRWLFRLRTSRLFTSNLWDVFVRADMLGVRFLIVSMDLGR
jgi:hypothetical protein